MIRCATIQTGLIIMVLTGIMLLADHQLRVVQVGKSWVNAQVTSPPPPSLAMGKVADRQQTLRRRDGLADGVTTFFLSAAALKARRRQTHLAPGIVHVAGLAAGWP